MKNKSVIILILALTLILIISSVLIINQNKNSDKIQMVEIVQDGKSLYSFDISKQEDKVFEIKYKDKGSNTIEIKNNKIRIIEADCKDKICINHGYLKSKDLPIVCLPHKLIIRFK